MSTYTVDLFLIRYFKTTKPITFNHCPCLCSESLFISYASLQLLSCSSILFSLFMFLLSANFTCFKILSALLLVCARLRTVAASCTILVLVLLVSFSLTFSSVCLFSPSRSCCLLFRALISSSCFPSSLSSSHSLLSFASRPLQVMSNSDSSALIFFPRSLKIDIVFVRSF